MAGVVVNETAGFSNLTGPFNLTIPGTTAGNALIATGVNYGGGTRTISSNSTGTWTQVVDNASFLCIWVCLNPGTNTTQVTLAATGAGFTLDVKEVSGLKAAGTVSSSTFAGTAGTNWSTNTISPVASAFSMGVAYQGDDSTTGSTMAGFTLSSGTNVTSGAVKDTSNGTVLVSGTKDIIAGAGQSAAGVWAISRNWASVYIAFELATGGGGGGTGSQNRLLLGVG